MFGCWTPGDMPPLLIVAGNIKFTAKPAALTKPANVNQTGKPGDSGLELVKVF